MPRFNFLVGDDAALDRLQHLTKRSSKANVVRDALSLYQYLARRIQGGEKIYVGRDQSHLVELAVTTLQNIPQSADSM